jgi:hypothetical protein
MKLLKTCLPAQSGFRRAARTAAAAVVALWSAVNTPAAQPPPHKIAAANINVIQNDTGNTANSVTATTTLSINDLRVRPGSNRGDINLQVGDTATNDLAGGLVMVAISQNGRDNGELPDEQKNYAAPAFDGNASGYWAVLQDLTDARAEFNINCAVAYFGYNDWLGGWARNKTAVNGGTNDLFTGSPGLVLGTHFRGISAGRSRVNLTSLGIFSTNSGVLLVNHAKNEGNYASSVANGDGTWEIYVKDNFGNNTAKEQDPAAFVFIPKNNTLVVSGKFGLDDTGTNAVVLLHSGDAPAFSITNFAVGRYRLTIPGGSPEAGVLIVSSEGGKPLNFDNTVSYEADCNSWIIEHRDVGVFPPPLEACTNEPVASFVYIPAATPGVSVTPTNILRTSEFGRTAAFTVALDLAPTNDVVIGVSSSNPAEATVTPASLTFTPDTWNLPQTVTVTGQDDAVADSPAPYTIVLSPAVSSDVKYNGLDPVDVQGINVDDEQPGISVTPTAGLVTTELGGSASFEVFLNRAPTNDVSIALSSSNPAEGFVTPASITFTPTTWSVPQIVTVTGVPDFRKDGNQSYQIVTAPAVSADLDYNGMNPDDVSLVNIDTDNPAVVWNYALPLFVAEGAATNYSVALTTRPDSNVVVTVVSGDTSVATVAPATLTFTPADWNTPKVVTVTGVDNLVTNGPTAFYLTNTLDTTDPLYVDFKAAKVIAGIRLDNEATLILPSGDCVYGLGMPPIGIDGQAHIEDVDATNYNNGTLTVALAANGTAVDRLEIRNPGVDAGQIGVNGSEVIYQGTVMGSFIGGLDLTPLVVSLNTNATLPAVQQLIRSITFGTPASAASLATRTVTFTLDDGLGATAPATKAIRVGVLRQTQYQEGGDYGYGGYYGANDIALSQVGAYTPWPLGRNTQEGLLIDWPDGGVPNESQVLLRFDNFVGTNYWQVPSNAVIVSAELLINVNNTGDGGKFYRLLIPWDSTKHTWSSLGEGIQTDDVEARSVYESQLGVEDGSGATGTGIISVGVIRDVQAWASGQTNYGWAIIGWPLRTDGTGFSPSEAADTTLRPRLRVKWIEPNYASASFRQGVNDYTGTRDTNLRQAAPDVPAYGDLGLASDWNDAGNTNLTQALLRFDDIIGGGTNQIPPGALIHAAVLELSSFGSDAMGDGGRFHPVLQAWDETTTTWNTWVDGIQADGIEAALIPTAVVGNASLNPDVQGTLNPVDVTADVQDWANGVRSNYGWALLPWPNGSNAWISRSSKSASVVDALAPEVERPRLRVYYTASAVALPAVLGSAVITPTAVQLPFTGSAAKTYTVLRAPAPSGPWTSAGTSTTGTDGRAVFTDSAPLPQNAFYRVVHP